MVLFSLLLAAAALVQNETAAPGIAFVHAEVVSMASERVLSDHTVLVREGRIDAVGPSAEVSVPAGATVIDGRGRYLLPGLVDMHVHTWFEQELLLFVANGVTTVRNMFGAPVHLAWREEIAAGDRLGPTIFTAGPIVDGKPAVWPGSREVVTAEEGRAAVRDQVEAGYDFIKVYSGLSVEAYHAIVEAARDARVPVMGHVPDAVGVEAALSAGQRTLEHLMGYETWLERDDSPMAGKTDFPSRLRAWAHGDVTRLPAVVQRTKESGAWNCVTLIVMDKWLEPDEAETELERPYMKYVPKNAIQMWRGMTRGTPSAMRAAGREGTPARIELTEALQRGGARLLLGTDMGNPYVAAGFSVHEELANLVAAGLSPYEALAAATRSPAECLGQADEFGTIAPGLRADLLLLAANPLEDVANAGLRVGVMVRGEWLSEEVLAARLAELAGD